METVRSLIKPSLRDDQIVSIKVVAPLDLNDPVILNEYQLAIIFCLGRIIDTKGPGIIILMPIIECKIHFLPFPNFGLSAGQRK